MKKCLILMAGVALMSAFTACSNDDDVIAVAEGEGTPLVVESVGLDQASTKAGIFAAKFSNGEKIGVFIYSGAKGTLSGAYNQTSTGIATTNVPYTQGASSWTATQPIILSSKMGVVYAYYPYNADYALTGSDVPVTVAPTQGTGISAGTKDADEQKDYMYADPVENKSNKAPTIALLTMKHALAMLSFKFVQSEGTDKYPGAGNVSLIKLANISGGTVVKTGSGSMNIATGAVTAPAGATANTISVTPNVALMGKSENKDIPHMLVYPGAVAAGKAQISVTVDGNTYNVAVPELASGWEQGKNYLYTLTLKGTALTITNVTITRWEEQTGGTGNLQNPV